MNQESLVVTVLRLNEVQFGTSTIKNGPRIKQICALKHRRRVISKYFSAAFYYLHEMFSTASLSQLGLDWTIRVNVDRY